MKANRWITPSPVSSSDSIRELIRQLLDEAGGVTVLAGKMRNGGIVTQMNAPVLEKWRHFPTDFDGIDPMERTLRLVQSTESLLPIHWLCGRLGCHFVHGPQHFNPIIGKGAVTWFGASLQLHEIRQTVIRAFLRDNPSELPDVSLPEGRLIAKSWAGVFAWIEGYLNRCGGGKQPVLAPPIELKPILFRHTEPWRVIAESMEGKSREAISEAIADPFGQATTSAKGELRYPKKDTLDKWAQSRGEDGNVAHGTRGPLDYTLALCVAAQSFEPVMWLAEQLGGYLVWPGGASGNAMSQSDLLKYWERTMVELSELDALIARAHLDGQVCPKELKLLKKEWGEVVEWMEGFLGGC